ncbi:MAG: transglutaminase domain-containing protein [Bacteriovoracaceae bacterium]|jgi:hypothetical protein|nr:transglutaminase domain-containing protein [Bacteriovoracaceae bacterium]
MKTIFALIFTVLAFHPMSVSAQPLVRIEKGMYNPSIRYNSYWNFWARVGGKVYTATDNHFLDYEKSHPYITELFLDMGLSPKRAKTESQIWEKVSVVWNFLGSKAFVNDSVYKSIRPDGRWPTILEHAIYYRNNKRLVWSACFSKAHLFAMVLGRLGIPRDRIAIATAHHPAANGLPTASHVYVALYIKGSWLYLDPTATPGVSLSPDLSKRRSVGLLPAVDYPHPFQVRPIPLSGLNRVPLLY